MSKFKTIISTEDNSTNVIARTEKSAINAMKRHIMSLEESVDNLKADAEKRLERVRKNIDDFSANDFIKNYHNTLVELATTQAQLKVAKEMEKDLFKS